MDGMFRWGICELFNNEIVQKIVYKTQKYSTQDEIFKEITPDGLKVFMALYILMSLVRQPLLQSFWTKHVSVPTPYFKHIMTHIMIPA